jgi:hypothetical protein
MFSIANLLDAAKAKAQIDSDYRLAKVIGKSHQVISGYRVGKSLPDESVIDQLCALSGDDPDVIAAQIQAARSKSPEAKNLWLRVAARMQGSATTAILSVCFAIALIAAPAQEARATTLNAYKTGEVSLLYIVSITFLSVGDFLQVRLRRFTGLFRLCLAASA